MKLLAFTDLHESQELLARLKLAVVREKVDIVVCAGDFTVFGHAMEKMLTELNSMGAPVVLIHGNHEDEEEVEALLPKFKNLHWAHQRVVDLQDIRFMGFGGGGFSRREPELEEFEKQHVTQFNDRTIFICHAPPMGTTLDEVTDEWHVGNESLSMLIRRRKPLVVIAGHIHECFHAHDNMGGTFCVNPGPDGEIIEVE
jgi:uncharacterized protein